MNQAADLYGKAKMYKEQLFWLNKVMVTKGSMGEGDYYRTTLAALNAKDYTQTMDYAKKYMAAFPDKSQPYTFYKRAAIGSDADTTSGTGVEALKYLDSVYDAVNKEKYKKDIFLNKYYTILYYIKKTNTLKKSPDFKVKGDGTKTPIVDEFLANCQSGIAVADSMLLLYTDPADDNNKFAVGVKAELQKNIDYYSKPQGKK
jgi:hypothetical protein